MQPLHASREQSCAGVARGIGPVCRLGGRGATARGLIILWLSQPMPAGAVVAFSNRAARARRIYRALEKLQKPAQAKRGR